jgi:hypothetical protein
LALPPNSPFVPASDIFTVSSMLSTKFIDSIGACFLVGVGQILLFSLVFTHLGMSSRSNQQCMKVTQFLVLDVLLWKALKFIIMYLQKTHCSCWE